MSCRAFSEWRNGAILICLVLSVLLPPSLPAEETPASFLERFQVAELKNGIRVLALSEPEAPLSVVQVWFRAGRAGQPGRPPRRGRTLLPRPLPQPSPRGPGPSPSRPLRTGVRVDSLCNQDTSFCSLEGPAEALRASADTLARLLAAPPRFSEATVQVQRRLLMQEALHQEASAHARFERLIRQQVFSVHPYGRSVSSPLYDRDHLDARPCLTSPAPSSAPPTSWWSSPVP